MKKIEIKPGITIETPLLKPAEAAAYCGLARSTFEQWSKDVPWSGSQKNRRYHVDDLEAWVRGDLSGIPFGGVTKMKKTGPAKRPRGKLRGIVDPHSQKLYPPRPKAAQAG